MPSLALVSTGKYRVLPESLAEQATNTPFPRRRLGRIVHDERGMASMEWEHVTERETVADPRQVLEIIEDPGRGKPLARSVNRKDPGGGFNPYQQATPDPTGHHELPPMRRNRDLRKLGEWIKMKKERGER